MTGRYFRVALLAAMIAVALPACRRDVPRDAAAAGGTAATRAGTAAGGGAAAGSAATGDAAGTASSARTAGGAGAEAAAAPAVSAGARGGDSRPVAPKVLVEVTNQAAALTVQVLDAQRVTPDTVRIEIAIINTSRAPEPLDVVRALTGRPGASFTPADLCLLTPDGSRRLFVLRDSSNVPQTGGGFEPLQPGERRLVSAIFPSPGQAVPKVTLVMADLVLPDIPISPAPTEITATGTS